MHKDDPRGLHVGRRDFIKTTAVISVAAALPGSVLPGQDTPGSLKSGPHSMKRKLLCLTDSPPAHEKFLESIRSIRDIDLNQVTVNYQKPQAVVEALRGKGADALLMILPRSAFSFGNLPELMGDLGIPIVLFAQNPDLILIDANFTAAVRTNNVNVLFATSQEQALEMVQAVAAPGMLEGRRPGKILAGTKKGPDGPAVPGGFQRMTCSNYLELKIRDADRFQQNIAGMHHVMVTGDHTKAIRDALIRMNVSLIGPSDFSIPILV